MRLLCNGTVNAFTRAHDGVVSTLWVGACMPLGTSDVAAKASRVKLQYANIVRSPHAFAAAELHLQEHEV